MVSELEEQFFKTFGIEPTVYSLWNSKETQIKNFKSFTVYPEITENMLLQLIIIRATNYKNGTVIELEPDSNIKDLEYEVLTHFINYRGSFDKHQIQQLFKEEI